MSPALSWCTGLVGTVRLLEHCQRPEVFSARRENQRPAHTPVTQTVRRLSVEKKRSNMAVSEVNISTLDPKSLQLIQRFIPDAEIPLIICHAPSLIFPFYYVITETRVARISINEKDTITARLEHIVSIKESNMPLLFIPDYIIILYGHDSQNAVISFSFPAKDKLYFKFVKILRDSYEKIKDSQVLQTKSPSERLKEIDSLLKSNLITEEEFKRKRKEILDGL